MKRNSTPFFTLCAAVVLAAALLPDVGNAKFMREESIPVERLIHNLEVVVKNEPNNIEAIYTLGRLHSLAFTQGSQEIEVFTKSFKDRSILKVPRIGRSSNPKSTFNESINLFPDKAKMHLAESLKFYKNAVNKAPQNALYSFSYAWVLDVGAVYAKDVKAPFLSADMPNAAEYQWKSEALRYYRNAYTISKERDGRNDRLLMGGDVVVSFEAAEAILKSFEGKILSKSEMKERANLQAHVKKVHSSRMVITPIIFPLKRSDAFANLTSGKRTSSFDLMGDGVKRTWKWVSPDTGILVWDPNHTGKVKSGRQLFGSVTWWMFWEDGYAPLRALDDNGDGVLTGKELRGISVWVDRNGNGISDPGEVTPASQFGIRSIRISPDSRLNRVLSSARGIEMKDGSVSPTFDWVPKSK